MTKRLAARHGLILATFFLSECRAGTLPKKWKLKASKCWMRLICHPNGQDGAVLSAHDYALYPTVSLLLQIINSLLTKLVRSWWLDRGLLFLAAILTEQLELFIWNCSKWHQNVSYCYALILDLFKLCPLELRWSIIYLWSFSTFQIYVYIANLKVLQSVQMKLRIKVVALSGIHDQRFKIIYRAV